MTPASGPVPARYHELNAYTRIIVDEALRRSVDVEIVDAGRGELVLSCGDRRIRTLESLSELTSAVAFRICDDKRHTRAVLEAAGIAVPPGRSATFDGADAEFLARHGELVVKPARGEQGRGVTVGVTDEAGLARALDGARAWHPQVLLEARCPGQDLRVVVIAGKVAAAALRRPARVVGDGSSTIAELIEAESRHRSEATDGASTIPLDDTTLAVVRQAGHDPDDVLGEGEALAVRGTANLHTGGTIHDVTGDLHPDLAAAAERVAAAIGIPVVGVDMIVAAADRPDHVVIEANEQPGLANHEPQPTAARFLDLLFPETIGGSGRSAPVRG